MYFLVNAPPPKPLDIATAGICDGVPSTDMMSSFNL